MDKDTGDWHVDVGGNRLTVTYQGNVGIGTTVPTAKLEVAGGETIVEQEAWQLPVFANGWVNYSNAYSHAGYFKDSVGVVHLRGLIKNGTLTEMAFTLPVGYRPAKRGVFSVITDSGSFSDVAVGRMDIKGAGQVIPVAGSNSWISLEGVTFRAEQ